MEQDCNFVEYATKKLVNFDRSIIVNSDQSGFNYELHSSRHYTRKRHRVYSVNSLNAVSHSYTIQPTFNSNGNFIGKCLLVLQQPNSSFGVNVEKSLFQPENLLVQCSNSGKVITSISSVYYDEIFKKNFSKIAFIHDTFAVKFQNDKFNQCFQKDSIKLQIPQKCPSTYQPSDVCLQTMEKFCRDLTNRVALDELNYDLRSSNGIIKLQSLMLQSINIMCSHLCGSRLGLKLVISQRIMKHFKLSIKFILIILT